MVKLAKISIVFGIAVFLIIQNCAFAQQKKNVHPIDIRPIAANTWQDNLPLNLKKSYNDYFKQSDDFAKKSIVYFFEAYSGVFFVFAKIPPGANDTSRIMFANPKFSSEKKLGDHASVAAILDTKKASLVRLKESVIPDFSWESALGRGLSYNGREPNLVYGCQVDKPFRFQDLTNDGVPELIVMGGVGQFYRDQNSVGIDIGLQTTIRIFDVAGKDPREIFFSKLSVENYGSEFFMLENELINPGFNSISAHYFNSNGEMVNSTARRAMREYFKLFFTAEKKGSPASILVLRKRYLSEPLKSNEKGFRLSEKDISIFDFGSGIYNRRSTIVAMKNSKPGRDDTDLGDFYMSNLNWSEGWPNQNYCQSFGYIGGIYRKYEINDSLILDLTNSPIHKLVD